MRVVRRNGGGRGLRGGAGKRVDGVFPGRPQSLRHQRRPLYDCSPGRGEWCRTAEQGAEHFIAKWIVAEKTKAGLRHAVVCPNVTGRTKKRIAQSKRARAGSLALIDKLQVARTCILQADIVLSFSGVTFALFCFVTTVCVLFVSVSSFFWGGGDVAFFPEYFCTIAVFSLYGEYVVRFFFPDGVFLSCGHGLDFFTSAYYVITQSIESKPIMHIMRPDSHKQLVDNSLRHFFGIFGDGRFPDYYPLSLLFPFYMKSTLYVFVSDDVFYLVTTDGLDLDIILLCENSMET